MKFSYEFNPFRDLGIAVDPEKKEEAQEAIQNYVKEQVLSHIGEGKSPIQGGHWKRQLSQEYLKIKAKQSGSKIANLELTGELLDALEVSAVNSEKLALSVVDSSQRDKAEGNQLGSYGREPNKANSREFIPQDGQNFRKEIIQGMKDILRRYERKD